MMGFGGANVGSAPDPGSPGFVAGTTSTPRVVHIVAGWQLRFYPDVVTVERGETVTFEVTAMGMTSHEFMVGPASDVAADTSGTPEVADIGMMQTKSVTYTFDGSGPFAFACHAPDHYERGMKGTIVVAP
jgi:plastocyanin